MSSGRVAVLDPLVVSGSTPLCAVVARPSGGTRYTDEEARLQAAIAMTQLSSTSTIDGEGGGDEGQWRHLVIGTTQREEERTEEDKHLKTVIVMDGIAMGPADLETGEGRLTPVGVDDSTPTCHDRSRVGARTTTGDSNGESRTMGECVESLSSSLSKCCDCVDGSNPKLGDGAQLGGNPTGCGIGGDAVAVAVDKSRCGDELYLKGKFVRTAQPSVDSGLDFDWIKHQKTTLGDVVGKSEDGLTVNCEGETSAVKRKMTKAPDEAGSSKMPTQRKPSKNAPSQKAVQSKRRGSSAKRIRVESTGCGIIPPTESTRESERNLVKGATLPDQSVRGMFFTLNPQGTGSVLVPMASLAPIPTTIVEAERQLLAWLPSKTVSVSHGLSFASTTSDASTSSVSLPSYAAPHFDAPIPRTAFAPPSLLPTSVSFQEDIEAGISSDAVAVERSTTSRRSGKRGKHRRVPDGRHEDDTLGPHSTCEAFQRRVFQVEEKREAERTMSNVDGGGDQSIKGVVVNEFDPMIRVTAKSEFESNQGVDLSMRKSGNRIGETPKIMEAPKIGDTPKIMEVPKIGDTPKIMEVPKIGDNPAFEIKTESKLLTKPVTDFGSCTSPLDLTTHLGSYGSLGSLKNFYTLQSSTIKAEQNDSPEDFGNFKDTFMNRTPYARPMDHDLSRVRHDMPRTGGLVMSIRHGSVTDDIKGSRSMPPTSSMICNKKSPSAESTVDECYLRQNTTCSGLLKVSASGSQAETAMNNLTDSADLRVVRSAGAGPLLPESVRTLLHLDAPPANLSSSVFRGDRSCDATAVKENSGHSRPGSQCSNDLQTELFLRHQENCRLPPKKRKMCNDFDREVHPSGGGGALDGQDLSKSLIKEEILVDAKPSDQDTSKYNHTQHHPLAVPLPAKYGQGGGGEIAQRLRESSVRDSISALEIVVKLEFRERETRSDGVNRNTAACKQEFGSDGMSVDRNSAQSSLSSSSSSSSPSPHRTTTNCEIHSAIQADEDGDLPLHVAVAQGLESAVDSLVSVMSQLQTHIDVFNKNRQTPLHVAVITNQPGIVRKLLQAGACVNLSDRKGHNSVHLAINNRCLECLRILLSDSKYPIDVDAMNYEGLMPLHLAVQLGDVHSVEALLSSGAQVNGVDGKNGRTALYYAAEKSDLASAELLLRTGASPSIASYSGCLPINAARSNATMVKLLDRYSTGGGTVIGSDGRANGGGAGGCSVAMTTTKTGGRDAKRREGKQGKSKA